MKTRLLTVAALLASTASAHAVGLDRSARPTAFIFEDGNKLQFSAGFGNPSIEGTDIANVPTGNIGDDFTIWGVAVRYELNDKLSFGLMIDEPYGADILYGPDSAVLGGTAAIVDSNAITAFARYKFNDRFSVHGGLVYQSVSADVTLSGSGYGGLSGYNARFSNDSALGYMLGVAYEIPDIALRVALTYHSEIDHELDTTETGPAFPFVFGADSVESITEVTTPETVRLDFQSGVAPNTLVFGHVRFSHYSATRVSPTGLQQLSGNPNASLTDLENAWDAAIGVGRRFNDKWAGSLSVGWEQKGEDDLVSPLGSTNGAVYLAVGASYQATDQIEISGGIRYTDFGNATPNVGGIEVGSFSGDTAISAGLRIQYSF